MRQRSHAGSWSGPSSGRRMRARVTSAVPAARSERARTTVPGPKLAPVGGRPPADGVGDGAGEGPEVGPGIGEEGVLAVAEGVVGAVDVAVGVEVGVGVAVGVGPEVGVLVEVGAVVGVPVGLGVDVGGDDGGAIVMVSWPVLLAGSGS